MDPVLVTYDPHQRPGEDLAHHIAARLRTAGWATELSPLTAHPSPAHRLLVVVGAPLHHHRWRRSGRRFLQRHHADLASTVVATFAVAPDASTDEALLRAREQLGRSLTHAPELAHLHATVFGRDDTNTPQEVADWCDELCFALDLATGRAQARAAARAHGLIPPAGPEPVRCSGPSYLLRRTPVHEGSEQRTNERGVP